MTTNAEVVERKEEYVIYSDVYETKSVPAYEYLPDAEAAMTKLVEKYPGNKFRLVMVVTRVEEITLYNSSILYRSDT